MILLCRSQPLYMTNSLVGKIQVTIIITNYKLQIYTIKILTFVLQNFKIQNKKTQAKGEFSQTKI